MATFILAPLILALLATLILPKILHNIDIDRCLDTGGKFDYSNNQCIKNKQNEK